MAKISREKKIGQFLQWSTQHIYSSKLTWAVFECCCFLFKKAAFWGEKYAVLVYDFGRPLKLKVSENVGMFLIWTISSLMDSQCGWEYLISSWYIESLDKLSYLSWMEL